MSLSQNADTADLEAFWKDFFLTLVDTGTRSPNESYNEDLTGDEFFGKWKFMSIKDIQISITTNRTDGFLLTRAAKSEMKTISQRVVSALHGKEPSRANIFSLFINPLVDVLFSAMKASDVDNPDALTLVDVSNFFRTLATLSFYRETLLNFFSRELSDAFPTSVDHDRDVFMKCLRCLGKRDNNSLDGRWDSPFKEDQLIRKAERVCTSINSELCFVKDVTIISTDDDQYRLSSGQVDEIGLVRVNIPNKSLGPVSTNSVSLCTSITLGLRLSGRGESALDTVKILLCQLFGETLPKRVRGTNTVALDRGYFKNQAIVDYLVECGFCIFGRCGTASKVAKMFLDVF